MSLQDNQFVNLGQIIGAILKHHRIKEMMKFYEQNTKLCEDNNRMITIPIVVRTNKGFF